MAKILFIFIVQIIGISISSDITIETSCGSFQGITQKKKKETENGDIEEIEINSFLGIPYGSPPIGKFRWMPSELKCDEKKFYNATKEGNKCFQMTDDVKVPIEEQSEDCLFLDIFTKNKTKYENNKHKPKAVLVWIHGGSIVNGWNGFSPIEDFLFWEDDLIVVRINYRLNIFGFLALKEFEKNDPRGTSGNYGITDQITALKWIQKNIEAFGGDKDRVTILGQSSGGTSIFALMQSKKNVGLFHSAISLSGSMNITMDLNTAEELHTNKIIKNTECYGNETLVNCLYDLSPNKLIEAIDPSFNVIPMFPLPKDGFKYSGFVIVDGYTVETSLEQALTHGYNDINIIFESTAQEMNTFPNKEVYEMSSSEFKKFFINSFETWDDPKTGEKILDLYDFKTFKSHILFYETFLADISFSCGLLNMAHHASLGFKSNVYLSYYAQDPTKPFPLPFGIGGQYSFHNLDLIMSLSTPWMHFFYTYEDHPEYHLSKHDFEIGKKLRNDWFEIIKNGKFPTWRRYNRGNLSSPTHYYNNDKSYDTYLSRKKYCLGLEKLNIAKNFWCVN